MQREQAKAQLARLMMAQMAPSERAEVVAFWFFCGFCEGDPQVAALPDTLRALVCRGVEPANPNDSQLDPLVQASLVEDLYGVTNSYLREALSERGMIVQQVDGEAVPMFPCPCCDYFSLSSESGYEICPVCFWEDDGVRAPAEFSAPNHLTLAAGRQNVLTLGACDPASVARVDRQARRRYRALHYH
ncbi:hypothetical protein LL270_12775 [Pseudomonas aestusnigri]|uniref:CPCC family cysteine-rich protein n=1 Tax=Halopseudomonas aestusnigri TaxID=857252 RepID=UPI001D1840A6|nr:CPCC family cysteine-rich protein [Halopseudomonas aestusnigri]MCC4261524.1 hypothetical protein [Halopseudomonas aestusnigri]